VLRKSLEKKDDRVTYIQTIQDMYNEVTISMTISRGEIKDFTREMRLHQG